MNDAKTAALPECIAHVEDWPDDRTPIGLVWDVDPKSVPVGTKLYALAALQSQPAAAGAAGAVQTLIEALKADPEYAWAWHCNVAMAAVDEGLSHYAANKAAAQPDHTKWPPIPLARCNPADVAPQQATPESRKDEARRLVDTLRNDARGGLAATVHDLDAAANLIEASLSATPEPVGEPFGWVCRYLCHADDDGEQRWTDWYFTLSSESVPPKWSRGSYAAQEAVPVFTRPAAAPAVPEVDPLQGAADWFWKAIPDLQASDVAGRLSIGYNRASRLLAAAQAKGGV